MADIANSANVGSRGAAAFAANHCRIGVGTRGVHSNFLAHMAALLDAALGGAAAIARLRSAASSGLTNFFNGSRVDRQLAARRPPCEIGGA